MQPVKVKEKTTEQKSVPSWMILNQSAYWFHIDNDNEDAIESSTLYKNFKVK